MRYRYYVSRNLQQGAQGANHGMRIPARELEGAVVERLATALDDPLELAGRLSRPLDAAELRHVVATATELAVKVRKKDHATIRPLLQAVQVTPRELRIELSSEGLCTALSLPAPQVPTVAIALAAPMRLTRTGLAMRLVQSNGKPASRRQTDEPMVKLLLRARHWWARLSEGDIDIVTLSCEEGVNDSLKTRVVRLAFLAPDIVESILAGQPPAQLNAAKLLVTQLPCNWRDQAEALSMD